MDNEVDYGVKSKIGEKHNGVPVYESEEFTPEAFRPVSKSELMDEEFEDYEQPLEMWG